MGVHLGDLDPLDHPNRISASAYIYIICIHLYHLHTLTSSTFIGFSFMDNHIYIPYIIFNKYKNIHYRYLHYTLSLDTYIFCDINFKCICNISCFPHCSFMILSKWSGCHGNVTYIHVCFHAPFV